ncbi:uncharacterized protein RSE6_06340 [Rhynchosporium secalis]|uniref:Uncharacterized protein n=1 Tax=Rhynchosporium secalis TaxID=38038 RepID=A0A1E1MA75_RHYSE|nr:uncharacterized protein RSE6_06340 [Rhynchosporium secalis]
MAPSYTESNAGMSPECPVHTRPCSITAKLHTDVCTSLPCNLAGYPCFHGHPGLVTTQGPRGDLLLVFWHALNGHIRYLKAPSLGGAKEERLLLCASIHCFLLISIPLSHPQSTRHLDLDQATSASTSTSTSNIYYTRSLPTWVLVDSPRSVSSHLISSHHLLLHYDCTAYPVTHDPLTTYKQATEEERRKEDSSTNELQDSASLHCN